MKRVFILMGLLGLVVTGCAQQPRPPHVSEPMQEPIIHPYPQKPIKPSGYYASRRFSVSGFNSVVISGPDNVVVNGHQVQSLLTVDGYVHTPENTFTSKTSASVKNGVLYISGSGNVLLDLSQPIQSISYNGNGNLSIKDIDESSTIIKLAGNSTTSMTGNLVLSRIETSDSAVLHAYWLNSSNLHIVATDRSKVFLAGIATDMDIIASGDADIDAKYLRVENSYVRTSQDADVGVTVKNAMSSLSTDKSTVYYYRDGDLGMHYLKGAGSALRMK